jgi:hypothetical protein
LDSSDIAADSGRLEDPGRCRCSCRRSRRATGADCLGLGLPQSCGHGPIFGATKLSHLDDAVASLDIHLGPEEIEQLTADYVPHQVADF